MLVVVAYHAFPGLVPSGFIGVDVFFVISGYLISRNLAAAIARGDMSFTEFYARRIRRIFPALIVVLAACYAIGWQVLFAAEFAQLGKHVAAGAAFVANVVFYQESGYFDFARHSKVLLHLWSLGIEEQFYIAWPIGLWMVWRAARSWSAPLAVIAALSFGACVAMTLRDATAAFYLPFFRVWELTCGAWVALAAPRSGTIRAWYLDTAVAIGVLIIGGMSLLAIDRTFFPGAWVGLPVLGACLVIAAGPGTRLSGTVLSSRAMVFVGLISYPLYLWHWPLLTFARILDGPLPSRTVRIAAVLASVVLAWMTFKWVEQPIRRRPPLGATAVALITAMIAVAAAGYAAYASGGLPGRAVAAAAQPYMASMHFTPRARECFDISNAHTVESNWFCRLNPAGRAANAFVFGDSFALALLPGFEQAARDRNVDVLFTGFSGCPPLLGIDSRREDQGIRNCRQLNERVLRYAVDHGITDMFLVAAWTYYTDGDYAGEGYNILSFGRSEATLAGSRAAFEHGLDETLTRYTAAGIRLHVVGKAPAQLRHATDLVREVVAAGSDASAAIRRVSVPVAQHRRLLAYVSGEFDRRDIRAAGGGLVSLLDLDPAFCDQAVCAFARPATSFYVDSGHLSVEGARLAAPFIARRLE